MKLYNTASRNIEELKPLHLNLITMYTCGPTVYDYTHIGHARKYIHDDLLKRTLGYAGYTVKHIMNITDVGHLVDDENDQGEDKLEKGAQKLGKTPQETAQFFTDYFIESMRQLNVLPPETYSKATDHIHDMIELIQKLEQNGHVYETDEAVYFDISTFPEYGRLSGQNLLEKLQKAREDVRIDAQKKSPADFAVWFKRVGHHAHHLQYWTSPWGDGFPGWHIECSAMSMKYLGNHIDIHTGGIDHIPVHHENEIAQSECATHEQFVSYWFHSAFLLVDGVKMSKSLNNFYTIDTLHEKGIEPLALRYLFLQSHYRQQLNFTWESVIASQTALHKLRNAVVQLRNQTSRNQLSEEKNQTVDAFMMRFRSAVFQDLNIPQALSVVWEVLKSNIPSEDKLDLVYSFDEVLGLGLASYEHSTELPAEVLQLAQKRIQAREAKDFATSDRLRNQLNELGYDVLDGAEGQVVRKARIYDSTT